MVTGDTPGRFFLLKAPNLGSLDSGTPIYFRRLQVGKVASYELDKDGQASTVKVFVKAPYDQYVTPNTRFWHASGIDVSLSASGLTVQTQSLLSILVGGIAFETPATGPVLPAAEADTVFTLFSDRAEAFKLPARDPQTYRAGLQAIRCAGWRPARRSSSAAFQSARSSMSAHKSTRRPSSSRRR